MPEINPTAEIKAKRSMVASLRLERRMNVLRMKVKRVVTKKQIDDNTENNPKHVFIFVVEAHSHEEIIGQDEYGKLVNHT